jgi:hypothetical protein
VYIPPSATEEDISAALEIEKLSADSPLELLERDPDAFFGRTTEILNVHVESTDVRTEDHFPEARNSGLMIGLLFTGIVCLLGGISLLFGAIRRHHRGKAIERSALLVELPAQLCMKIASLLLDRGIVVIEVKAKVAISCFPSSPATQGELGRGGQFGESRPKTRGSSSTSSVLFRCT